MGNVINYNDACHLLANNIIVGAAKDYQRMLCGDMREDFNCNINECENFFTGQFIQLLSGINGKVLMEDLKKECVDNGFNWPKINKSHNIRNEPEWQ